MADDGSGAAAVSPRSRRVPTPAAPMVVAAVLAATAGAIDAICFDRVFGVFPANQSGNAVLLGIGIGAGRGGDAWRPALAIVGFALGVAIAILLGSRISRRRRPELLLMIEVAMLVPLAIVLLATPHPRSELSGPETAGLLLLTTGAMGIQTEVIGRVAGVAVATTYQSGAIVRIAELVTRPAVDARRHPSLAPRLAVLLVVLASYVSGAALGAALGSWSGSVFVPVAMLAAVGALIAAGGTSSDTAPSPPGPADHEGEGR